MRNSMLVGERVLRSRIQPPQLVKAAVRSGQQAVALFVGEGLDVERFHN